MANKLGVFPDFTADPLADRLREMMRLDAGILAIRDVGIAVHQRPRVFECRSKNQEHRTDQHLTTGRPQGAGNDVIAPMPFNMREMSVEVARAKRVCIWPIPTGKDKAL
jgi:hypothetical protein